MLNRRDFLIGSASLLGAAAFPHRALADTAAPNNAVRIRLNLKRPAVHVPENFTGLSYESSALGNANFFSPDNKALIGFVRGLGRRGVLRIGGNSSEFCDWQPDLPTLQETTIPPTSSKKPHRRTIISPESLANLAGFLDATDWNLIYGVNLGTGTPQEAADEAQAVATAVSKRLLGIQIGNEPDLYSRNGLRPSGWKFEDYLSEWTNFAEAISEKIRNVMFGGPDVAGNRQWIEDFARSGKSHVAFLSGHYYAGGPPSNPNMDIPHLLETSKHLSSDLRSISEAAISANLSYRMSETNSCYGGGKLGVSDTFASALWAANYMLELAAAGVSGVNFHGGGKGPYTPIAGSPEQGFSARPIYYGMLLAGQVAGTELLECRKQSVEAEKFQNLHSYAGAHQGEIRVIVINSDVSQAAHVTIEANLQAKTAFLWRLSAPAIGSTDEVMLAQAPVDSNGVWKPAAIENTPVDRNAFTLDIPAGSAVIAFIRSS